MPPKAPTRPDAAPKVVARPDGTFDVEELTKDELADIDTRFQEHLAEQEARNAPTRDERLADVLQAAESAAQNASSVADLKAANLALIEALRQIFGGGTP